MERNGRVGHTVESNRGQGIQLLAEPVYVVEDIVKDESTRTLISLRLIPKIEEKQRQFLHLWTQSKPMKKKR